MSENKHTPEPWRTDAECGFPQDIHDSKGNLFLRCGSDFDNEIYGEANARRIVACVNALEGLNDYALSGGWSFRGIEAYAKGLEKQRDELLAELEKLTGVLATIGITSGLYDDEQNALKAACDVIARAKGEQ